ncbi:SRPBCC domain-containing protein [Embleya sp. NPDC050154]|uniref:SRPBCC family protein n=1 Tax=unclassified Embleya TaxID=2699296 RepID=UPI00379F8595
MIENNEAATTDGFRYTIARTLDAPVADVWQAWTIAEQYAQWAGTKDVTLDARPGGSWSGTVVLPDGRQFPITGSYLEVVEKRRLVVAMDVPGRAEPDVMTVELTDRGTRTDIVVSQTCDSVENRDRTEAGSNMLLDGLAAHLEGRRFSTTDRGHDG